MWYNLKDNVLAWAQEPAECFRTGLDAGERNPALFLSLPTECFFACVEFGGRKVQTASNVTDKSQNLWARL